MRSKGSMPGKNLSQAQQEAQYRAIFLSPGRSLSLAEYRHATYFVIGIVCTLLPFSGIKDTSTKGRGRPIPEWRASVCSLFILLTGASRT